jgi:hypothetical protein
LSALLTFRELLTIKNRKTWWIFCIEILGEQFVFIGFTALLWVADFGLIWTVFESEVFV